MKKGIGPQGLGSPVKMYDSPAKQVKRNLADIADKKRVKANKAEFEGKTKKAERLRKRASKLDEKHAKKAFKNIDLDFRA